MMTRRIGLVIGVVVVFLVGAGIGVLAQEDAPQEGVRAGESVNGVGTAFTYQGVLTDGEEPANGTYDLEFRLFDAVTGGNQIGSVVTVDNQVVSNGLLAVTLDFGQQVFGGSPRWLAISVRPGSSSGAYETLNGRQPLTASPYAIHAGTAHALAAEMQPPAVITVTATSGGSLSQGNYYFKIVASNGVGTSVGSAEVVCAVDGSSTNRCALAWEVVPGAAAYHIYKGATSNSQNLYQTAVTNNYNYDTDSGSTAGSVPTTATAFVNYINPGGNSWLLGGRLGIGTTNPEVQLHLAGSGQIRLEQVGSPVRWDINTFPSGRLVFRDATNEINRLVIEPNGNVGIGVSDPGVNFQVGSSGDGTVARANAWTTFSDERYKTGTVELENAAELVEQLEGVRFTWKESGEESIGFIAQDVVEVLPEVVHADEAGYLSVDYSKMTPILVEALQEQQATIDTLQAQNEQMAANLAAIKAQLAAMDSSPSQFSWPGMGWGVGLIGLAGLATLAWRRQGGRAR